tara:strand:+ start:5809 stop:6723 length:915 start_codon:yes stop_codon:yes gene_type:complete
MHWIAIIIKIDAVYTEVFNNLLIEKGALSVDTHDAAAETKQEESLFVEFNDSSEPIWSNVEITALFEEPIDVIEILHAAAQSAKLTCLPVYRVKKIEDQDWVHLTQSQFDPIKISPKLWVVPSWHQAPDSKAINLILDPGLAFGTGTHPTTKLCLSWLDKNLKGGERVLDYGCGSGILAIAALKLGANCVVGVDIDPIAVEVSTKNAVYNQCDQNKIKFYLADYMAESGQIDRWADVIIANILVNPLLILAPLLGRVSNNNGRIVLSGILTEQVREVAQIYQKWFKIYPAWEQDGWSLLVGIRK